MMPKQKSIADLLVLAKIRLGSISQNKLADVLNLDQTTLSKWCCGKAFPSDSSVVRTAAIAGESQMEWLLQLNLARTEITSPEAYEMYMQLLEMFENSRAVDKPQVVAAE